MAALTPDELDALIMDASESTGSTSTDHVRASAPALADFLAGETPHPADVMVLGVAVRETSTTTKALLAIAAWLEGPEGNDAHGAALIRDFVPTFADHERTTL